MENNKKITNVLHDRMSALYINQWRAVINNQSAGRCKGNKKLRSYCLFKDGFALSPYLVSGNGLRRRLLSTLRISPHKLEIEVGRHKKPVIPANQRYYRECDSRTVEDEFRFIRNALRRQASGTNFGIK